MDNSVRQGAQFDETPLGTGKLMNIGQALEGKDVKELLLNVGSGGGAAAAPVAGGAGAGGDAGAAEEKAEEKEEGTLNPGLLASSLEIHTNTVHREGRVRRGHGLRSLRLNDFLSPFSSPFCLYRGLIKRVSGQFQMHISLAGVARLVATGRSVTPLGMYHSYWRTIRGVMII
jgi:hypothetical protein